MLALAAQVDGAFAWPEPHTMSDTELQWRASTLLVVLLRDRFKDEGRSDLLTTKAFVLLFQDWWYRAHNDNLCEYNNGSFVRSSKLSAACIEFAMEAFRLAQALFLELETNYAHVKREVVDLCEKIGNVRDTRERTRLLDNLFKHNEKKEDNERHWCGDARQLCGAILKQFAEQKHRIEANYLQWASTPVPKGAGGANFTYSYLQLSENGTVEQKPKSPHNNCYGTVPTSLQFEPADSDVERMCETISSTFWGTDGAFEMFVAMQALSAKGKEQPDKMLVPVGWGADGKSIFYDRLSKTTWGDGHGSCPCSMLQIPEEFRKTEHSYVGCNWIPWFARLIEIQNI